MASPPSNEASEIRRRGRHRLIGAIAIVVLLVVFVPMILDREPRSTQPEPVLEIPRKDNAPALPQPAAQPSGSAASKPQPAAAGPAAAESAPRKAEAPAVAANREPAPKLEGFAVQVGAFRDEEKLKQARAKLAAAGVAHYIERRDTASGDLTRLRAGPFATRGEAEKALNAVRAASLEGQVVPLP